MKLTNSQIIQAVSTLKTLPTLKGAPRGVHALAKSKNRLDAEFDHIQEAAKAAFKDAFGDLVEVPANHTGMKSYQDAIKSIDNTETEVDVHQCSLADLALDKNDISPAQLASISFVISDF